MCVKIWEGNNFDGGWEREFGVGNYVHGIDFPNDGISSLKVRPGCHVDIWDGGLFAQTSWHVSLGPGDYDNNAFLTQGATDNAASSVKVSSSVGGNLGLYVVIEHCCTLGADSKRSDF